MAILLFVHLTRHSSTASEQLSCISLWCRKSAARFDERGWVTERYRIAQATAPILDSTIFVGSTWPGTRLALAISAPRSEARSCSSVSDVKAMSRTYVRFANPYKVAGLSTRMRFRVASSHMC